jgi:hypothetical protein
MSKLRLISDWPDQSETLDLSEEIFNGLSDLIFVEGVI